jgi:hypothetical protein
LSLFWERDFSTMRGSAEAYPWLVKLNGTCEMLVFDGKPHNKSQTSLYLPRPIDDHTSPDSLGKMGN